MRDQVAVEVIGIVVEAALDVVARNGIAGQSRIGGVHVAGDGVVRFFLQPCPAYLGRFVQPSQEIERDRQQLARLALVRRQHEGQALVA
jgi:hypothetical protein